MSPVLLFGAVIGLLGIGFYIEQLYLERKQAPHNLSANRKDETVDP